MFILHLGITEGNSFRYRKLKNELQTLGTRDREIDGKMLPNSEKANFPKIILSFLRLKLLFPVVYNFLLILHLGITEGNNFKCRKVKNELKKLGARDREIDGNILPNSEKANFPKIIF